VTLIFLSETHCQKPNGEIRGLDGGCGILENQSFSVSAVMENQVIATFLPTLFGKFLFQFPGKQY
jgi:hypothetical protein